jgi:phosphoglycolate phosphatase
MMYRLLSFDLDGTLADTATEIASAVNATLVDLGQRPLSLATISGHIGAGVGVLLSRVLAELDPSAPLPPFEQILQCLRVHYRRTAGTEAQAYPGALAALSALRAAGVRVVCVTNKDAAYAQRVLESTGLAGCIEMLVGGDSLPVRKPDPATLQHVLAAFDCLPAQAAHIGDSHTDIETARNAGVAAWAVPYGYNGGVPIALAAPQRVFERLSEVAEFVIAANRAPAPAHANSPEPDACP